MSSPASQQAYERRQSDSEESSDRRSIPEALLDEIESKIEGYQASIGRFKENQRHLDTLRNSQDFSDHEVCVFEESIQTDQLVVTSFANDVKMMIGSAEQAWNRRSKVMRQMHQQGHLREDVAKLWGDNQRQLGHRVDAIKDKLVEMSIPA